MDSLRSRAGRAWYITQGCCKRYIVAHTAPSQTKQFEKLETPFLELRNQLKRSVKHIFCGEVGRQLWTSLAATILCRIESKPRLDTIDRVLFTRAHKNSQGFTTWIASDGRYGGKVTDLQAQRVLRQVGLEIQDMLHRLLAPGKEGAGPPDCARHWGYSPAARWGSLQGHEYESGFWQGHEASVIAVVNGWSNHPAQRQTEGAHSSCQRTEEYVHCPGTVPQQQTNSR